MGLSIMVAGLDINPIVGLSLAPFIFISRLALLADPFPSLIV